MANHFFPRGVARVRRAVAIAGAVAGLSVLGCGMPLTEVSGTVTLDGEHLTAGKVTFFPAKYPGQNVGGHIQPDGRFAIPSVPGGPARVVIQPLPPNPRAGGRRVARNAPDLAPVPVRYTDPETSELTVTIAGGSQRVDLELRSDGE